MKATYTIFSFVLLTSLFQSNITNAQKWSAGVLGGYNIAPMGSFITQGYNTPNYYYSANIKGSYGKGISYGIDVSYKAWKHVTFNLEGTMLNGQKINYSEYAGNELVDLYTESFSNHANTICINPGVTFTCNEEKKIQPFVTADLVFCVYDKMIQDETDLYESGNNPFNSSFTERQFTGELDLGYKVAIGASYKLSDHFSVSLAINGTHLTGSYKKAEVTKYTENGVDKLATLTTLQTQIEFTDVVTYSYTSSNSPNIELKPYLPFSSVGLQLGLKYFF